MSLNQRNLRGVPIDLKLNKTPAQAFTPPAEEKKCVLRRLRLKQGQMQELLGLMVGEGGGLDLQIWDLNRAHETETTVFPIPQVFSMCGCRLCHKRKYKRYSKNSAMNTL